MFWIGGCVFSMRGLYTSVYGDSTNHTYETMDCLTVYFINTNISQLLQHVIIVITPTPITCINLNK